MTAEEKLKTLKQRLLESADLEFASALLGWDQTTFMPPGGAEARGRQMALLSEMSLEKAVDPEIGHLLDELDPYGESLPYDDDDAALIRAARRQYEKNIRIPPELYGELVQHTARSYQLWTKARPENDFKRMQPELERTLDLSRQIADCFPGYEHIADPLIDLFDYGMKASDIRRIFAELRQKLVPIVQAISAQEPADDSILHQEYSGEQQLAFSRQIAGELGYDFERGRLDLTHHPFMTKFSLGDVRITTRVDEHDLSNCLFSVMHESGHAMYEQGINRAYEGTPLGIGTSSGVHESQSRTWENLVGRSRPFWEHYYPQLQQAFPNALAGVDLDVFYQAINKVQRSLIRTEADEVTYNLHPMIRFDLELQLLDGSLEVRDLPEAWNARYTSDLGLTPPDDRDGVLQDVHWYGGPIGGVFQGYTLGNILGAMFFEKALKAHPEIPDEIRQGQFNTLRTWLTQNIYQYGSKYTPPELVERVTGGGLSVDPLVNYLTQKYSELYTL
jgi:carboxypeptidase Taq